MEPEHTIASLGEDATIEKIAETLGDQELPSGWVGIGDDAAVCDLTPGTHALTTTDLLVESVHFRRQTVSAEDLGWKAMAVNASDIAGMGGTPRWATVSVALPPELSLEWVEGFYRGARDLGERVGLAIVGGDTVRSPGPIMIAVTVVGEAAHPRLRSGARPGDLVLVTGTLGASAAGLWLLEHPDRAEGLDPALCAHALAAHRRPYPHVQAGLAVGSPGARAAMMDNSDGLARSALWLAKANQLTVNLLAESLPIDGATRAIAARAGVDPLDWALYGGEDYGLVILCAPETALALMDRWPGEAPLVAVGQCEAGPPRAGIRRDGDLLPLQAGRTYQHFG